jgi:hypothetical protein
MGQMAAQLGTPAKSSTGGTLTATPTGVKHTAAPAAQAAAPAAPAGKKPVKIAAKKKAPAAAPAPQQQTASIVHNGKVIAEGFSLFRKS